MTSDEKYDDLTALFEAQDDALQSDAFVDRVMTPIYKRARWRTPLLFGAGGLGIGAALSQIGGLWQALKEHAPETRPDFSLSLEALPTAQVSLEAQPAWMAAAVLIVLCCAALVVSERA